MMQLFVAILVSSVGFAQEVKQEAEHHHREHGAHVHGSASLAIAFEGSHGKIELHSPGDSIIGFEHEAKTAQDKKTQETALKTLESKMAEMVAFDPALKCAWSKEKVEVKLEKSGHGDVNGAWAISCEKSPVGGKITFNVQKYFPKLKDVDVQIIADSFQTGVEANKVGTEVNLK